MTRTFSPALPSLFLGGLLISSVLVSPFVLDFTLNVRLISICLMISLFFFLLWRQKTEFRLRVDALLLSGLLFVVLNTVSVLWAGNKAEGIYEASKILVSGLVFACTVLLLDDKPGFAESVGKVALIVFFLILIAAALQILALPDFTKPSAYLVTGLNGHKNLLSSFLFLDLFFILLLYRSSPSKLWKTLALAAICAGIVLLLFLRTRAVWMAIAVSGLLFAGMLASIRFNKTVPGKKTLIAAVLLLTLAANIFFLVLLPRLINLAQSDKLEENRPGLISRVLGADEERLTLWHKTYVIFRKNPVLGTGPGNWQVQFPDATLSGLYRAEDLNFTFQRPHNDFLWILTETGVAGLNLLLLFVFTMLVLLYRQVCLQKNISVALMLCALAGYCVISFFDFPKERSEHLLWLHVLLGLCYHTVKKDPEMPALFGMDFRPRTAISLSVLGLALTFTAAMRYKAEYYTRKMYDLKASQQYQQVIKACGKAGSFACSLDPTSVPLAWYSGNAYAALGQYNMAKQELLRAYDHNPYNRNVLNDLGSAYIFEHDTTKAITFYREAARVSPRYDEPRLNLAAVYIAQKNYTEANEWLQSIKHDSRRRESYQRIVNMRLSVKN